MVNYSSVFLPWCLSHHLLLVLQVEDSSGYAHSPVQGVLELPYAQDAGMRPELLPRCARLLSLLETLKGPMSKPVPG